MSVVSAQVGSGSLSSAWSVRRNFATLFEQQQDTFGMVNGLRFISFLWILVFHNVYAYGMAAGRDAIFAVSDHTPAALWWVFNADKAVDMFFLLSGFLISLILFREVDRSGTVRLRRFYFRRYLRLTPVYALLLLIYALSGARNAEYTWTNLFYVNNFLAVENMPLQWTWTLAVEEQFYLLLPLILIGVAKLPGKPFLPVLLGLLGLSFVARLVAFYYLPGMWDSGFRALLTDKAVYPTYYANIYDNLVTRFGPFVCGALVAYAYCFHPAALRTWISAHNGRRALLTLLALGTVLLFAFLPVFNGVLPAGSWQLRTYLVVNHTLFAAGLAWLMLTVFLNTHHVKGLPKLLSLRVWQPFSQLTYSMYLVHMLVIVGVMYNVQRFFAAQSALDDTVRLLVTLASSIGISFVITLLIGVICWVFVEKPFLNLRDQSRLSAGATGTAPELPR